MGWPFRSHVTLSKSHCSYSGSLEQKAQLSLMMIIGNSSGSKELMSAEDSPGCESLPVVPG